MMWMTGDNNETVIKLKIIVKCIRLCMQLDNKQDENVIENKNKKILNLVKKTNIPSLHSKRHFRRIY